MYISLLMSTVSIEESSADIDNLLVSPVHDKSLLRCNLSDRNSLKILLCGDFSKVRFTFQEYFRRMTEDASRWGEPFKALLGAYDAQLGFGLPSIGGKDSMSGTFNDMDVPNTLVSFAVDVAKSQDVITPEFKKAGNKIVLYTIKKNEYDLPDYEAVKKLYSDISKDIADGVIVSAYTLDAKGIAAAVSKMAFGNKLGVKLDASAVSADELFAQIGRASCRERV